MSKNLYKFSTLSAVAALGLGLMVSGCGDSGSITPYPFNPAPVAGTLKFDFNLLGLKKADVPLTVKTFNFTLMAGEEISLEDYQVEKDESLIGSNQTVEITDVDEDVDSAIVTYLDENGKVLAADILAVEVGSEEAYEPAHNAATAIEFIPEEVTVAAGEEAEFVALLVCAGDEGGDEGGDEVAPEDEGTVSVEIALDELENWASEDETIATADGGAVIGVAEGETNVTAEYTNADGTLSAALAVFVTGDTPVSDYKIVDAGELGLEDGGDVMFLDAANELSEDWATEAANTYYVNEVTLKVEAAADEGGDEGGDTEDITWTWSTEAEYMTVDENGKVTITGAGEGGKIVATNSEDETQTVEFGINAVEVAPALVLRNADGEEIAGELVSPEDTKISGEVWYMPFEEEQTIRRIALETEEGGDEGGDEGGGEEPATEVKFGPFTGGEITYTSSDEAVATIDAEGNIVIDDEAQVEDMTTITATANANNSVTMETSFDFVFGVGEDV